MIFRIIANAQFEAKDLDDAFKKLSTHFINVEESQLFIGGKIETKPEEDFDE